jgi:facilitated trehalose transporter
MTTQLLLKDQSNISLSAEEISWFTSVLMITLPIGAFISGYITEKFGRRNAMIIINILAIISWIIIGFSSRTNRELFFIELLVGRVIGGIMTGMSSTPAVMYVSEICHPSLRGRMTLLSSPFNTALGLCTVYLLGYIFPVSLVSIITVDLFICVKYFLIRLIFVLSALLLLELHF